MSQLFYGSINVSELIEEAKKCHSAFTKANNKKLYASVNVWLNDEPDQYGNILSIQLNPAKEKKDTEKRVYIGNCKKGEPTTTPITKKDAEALTEPLDDLPF